MIDIDDDMTPMPPGASRRAPRPAAGRPTNTPVLPPVPSDHVFQLMVQGVRDYSIFLLDPTGHIATWNLGAERINGYTRDEALGRHVSMLYVPEEQTPEKAERELEIAKRLGYHEEEGWRLRKGGIRFWANVVISKVVDESGTLIGYVKVTRDLTDRRAAEEATRRSEEKLQILVEGVQEYAIYMLDVDGVVVSWNVGAERIKGYTAREIIGKHFSAFFTPEDVAAGRPAWELETALRLGSVTDEGWRMRKDGRRFWANVVLTALRNKTGEVIGFSKVTRDMSERREAEERLRHSEQRLRDMIDAVKDYAIFMLDPDGNVATWNGGAERLKGYRPGEIIGAHFSKFYPPEDRNTGKPAWELETAARVGRYEEEGWRVRKDGSRFWANVVLTAVRNTDGVLIGYTKVTRDMTDRRAAEEIARQAKDDLEKKVIERTAALRESNRDLEQFAYIASHDLQEPIRRVFLYGDRLRQSASTMTEDQRGWLERLTQSAGRLKGIVQDLLNFSRLTHARVGYEDVDLSSSVRDAMTDLEVRLEEVRGKVELGPLPTIRANRSQMIHLFQNLISNSLKFARPGVPPVVRVHAQPTAAGRVRIIVEDNGIGFETVYNEKIFKPFQRLHSRDQFEGSGIGLSIVQRIVNNHGGTVEAVGRPGAGATFTLDLPVTPTPVFEPLP